MLNQNQDIANIQSVRINKMLQESVNVLKMSSIELDSYIRQELDKNSFIEEEDIKDNSAEMNLFKNDNFIIPKIRRNFDYDNNMKNFIEHVSYKKNLRESLLEQIHFSFDGKQKDVAIYLTDFLTEEGYLNIDVEQIVKTFSCTTSYVQEILGQLKSLEPVGIFASNLKDCLSIQIRELYGNDSLLLKLVQNIELIAHSNWTKLLKLCQVSLEELKILVRKIKSLNPRPAQNFSSENISYKFPDVILKFDSQNRFYLRIANYSPSVKLRKEFYSQVNQNLKKKKDRDFIHAEMRSAKNLIKFIDERSATILKISHAIVEYQMQFFLRGIMHLKPMTLRQIALKTGFNESTVSRSVSNKYMETSKGVYELKYFFSSGITDTTSHEIYSSTSIKEFIRNIIKKEDGRISDHKIMICLNRNGISISRRTVSKYRNGMRILNSNLRSGI